MFCSPWSGAITHLCTCFAKHRNSNCSWLIFCLSVAALLHSGARSPVIRKPIRLELAFQLSPVASQSQASGHLWSERGGMLGRHVSYKGCRRPGKVTARDKERLSGLEPPPQRGSGWWPQWKQVTWAKAESRNGREVWRLDCPVPSSPLMMSCYTFLRPCEGKSSGLQITATNAERAGQKPLCERVKNLIHLKTC